LKSGDTIAVGGFGLGGTPETLLNALSTWENGPSDLTVVSLTAGVDNVGLGRLFEAGKVKRMISSYVGENKVSFAWIGGLHLLSPTNICSQ
jgi:acyl CoA:acetate/3-ketoacid CoA transferase alpha subunit